MTKEEAINFGEMFLEVNKDSKNSNTYEFVEMALKLLEHEPCEDAISRQAAQAKIKSICNEYGLSYEDGERKPSTGGSAYALGHAFDDLPPVTPKTDGMTNGEVIQTLFPNASVYEHGSTYSVNNEYNFNSTWWNTPYKLESEDNE